MENKRSSLTPLKRPNDASDANRSKKPTPNVVTGYRKLKILLPNGMTVVVKLSENLKFIDVKELVKKVKEQYDRIMSKKVVSSKRRVNWDGDGVCFVDIDFDQEFKDKLKLSNLELGRVYNLRLDDGSKPADIYENMWDLTPDTDLLMELPEEYTFETALADLIDNSLQAVWSNDKNDRRLIRVEVSDEKISIVDTGLGMDNSTIEKWGKMGASLHRASKTQAIGGKPPYLNPAFGMFGYGGFIASMHLGRHTEVSSKTKNSKKVYMLRLQRDALVRGSGSKQTWRTSGGVRDPSGDELELSPGGSFTKVDIYEPKMKNIDIRRLKCKLKDIYFPYIQCDDFSKGKTIMPIEFEVNGDDLAEIPGGEVAITNLSSCNGPEFVLQLHFELNHDNAITTSSPGSRSSNEANARLRCVYLPVKEGKETIETILETLKEDGLGYKEEVGSFSHVSCRRLGRLLPDARWAWIPFMDFRQRKGEKSQILKRICMRVKCFIETDAGFNPTPSKTDFAHQNPYTTALRNLGGKPPLEKETGVRVDIRRDGKSLTPVLLDKQYQQWLLDMHDQYDEEAEADCGTDDPVLLINHMHKKELHISSNVVRVHKSVRRKGKSWVSGQRIKILRGACAGFHNNNVYATLEYILLEGLQGDTGGDAWLICRTINVLEENGSVLDSVDGNPNFDLRKSVSIPMNVIDSGKCLAVDDSEWIDQLDKQNQKVPSSIEMLTSAQCRELGIESLPEGPELHACNLSRCEVVAVVRPANYKSRTPTEHLEQKFVMKDNFQMSLSITYSKLKKSHDENIYSGRVTPSSRRNLNGLYVFQPKSKSHPLFRRAGVYTFTFFIKDSSCKKCVVKVRVKASSEVHKWALNKQISHNLWVGCPCEPMSVSMFDEFNNQIPFLEEPELVIKIKHINDTRDSIKIKRWNPSTSLDGSALIIEDLLIESFTLDELRPSYDATMMLCLQDGSHLLDIPIKVLPGPIKRFTVQPENFEDQLIPGEVIKELSLEFFDAYGNHVQENEKVELSMNGFGWVGGSTSNKVDAHGCLNLGCLLRVSAGYGRNVSLSVSSLDRVVTTEEWQIDKRKLRAASMIPERCVAGSQLENIAFEVVNSKGDVDVHFHDEDKIGQSHTLVIKSQFRDIDESVKYVFREGRCVVRSVPVPHEEGEFIFLVAHSRYPELQLTIKILVELSPEMEPLDTIHQSADDDIVQQMDPDTHIDHGSVQHHTPERNTSSLLDRNASSLLNIYNTPESCSYFQQDLGTELYEFKLKMSEHEEKISLLEEQIRAIEEQIRAIEFSLSKLDVVRDQTLCTYGSPGKNEIISRVESMTDSAAGLVMKLFSERSEQDHHGLLGNIIGVVALLGTAPTSELSRLFAEYLGDQMLAVVCRSYEDVHLIDTYEKSGKLKREPALNMFPAELEESINGRYHVLCLENMSPCNKMKDDQGKILLPLPTLPNGSTPAGFMGYAVNLIEVDEDHVDTKTDRGYGLRETLFYRLFGLTQVYESRDDLKEAIHCINDGAISKDGGIIRGNGAVYLGCLEPDIIFPVIAPRSQGISQQAMKVMNKRNELKLKLKETKEQLNEEKKYLEIASKKFTKRLNKYCTQKHSATGSSQVSPITCVDEKPVIADFAYISGTPNFDLSADASQNLHP